MAGFRDFQTGEVLTAANVNDFLAKQSVMKFADASARDTALGTATGGSNALREGMVAYLDDEDLPSFYNGSEWTTEFGGGGLVAVKHALFTGTQTNSTASSANFAVTDLSITHTLSDSSNKLIISAYLGAVGTNGDYGNVGLAVADDGSLIGIGDANPSNTRVAAGGRIAPATSNFLVTMPSISFVYEPADTASHTYTVRAINISAGTSMIYINRPESSNAIPDFPRASSALVIQEVKV